MKWNEVNKMDLVELIMNLVKVVDLTSMATSFLFFRIVNRISVILKLKNGSTISFNEAKK